LVLRVFRLAPLLVLFGGVLTVCVACAEQKEAPAPSTEASDKSRQGPQVQKLGKDREATLRALAMPHHRIASLVGAHRIRCTSSLKTAVTGQPDRKVKQQLDLRMDDRGNFTAEKNTHPRYGFEVVWVDGWLYSRQRSSVFIKRTPRKGEPEEIADRLYGLLPAYIDLLGRFLELEIDGEGKASGKIGLRLSALPDPAPAAKELEGNWRQTIAIKALRGRVTLDGRSGVPLQVELEARWTFHPPAADALPASGIPTAIDTKTAGSTTLSFRQRIEDIGKQPAVQAPPAHRVRAGIRRRRIEIERQMLIGERPLPREKEVRGAGTPVPQASKSGASP
jgi:hypothetical protein